MPFDGKLDIHHDRRRQLIDALRGKLPKDFRWDFTLAHEKDMRNCGTVGCAIGVAFEMGLIEDPDLYELAEILGLRDDTAAAIFAPRETPLHIASDYGVPYRRVTPAMVADKLEALDLALIAV